MSDFNFDFLNADAVETADTIPAPITYTRRVGRRRYLDGLKKQALSDLIPELPPADTDLYLLSNGSGGTFRMTDEATNAFEFGHFIPVLVRLLGDANCILYVSTWTMNRSHALNMLQLVDDGKVARLAVMTDPYFLRRESAVANQLVEGIRARQQRFKAFRNHAKILALSDADGTRFCSVLASANLSSQPRVENFTLSTDPGLYAFLRDQFFEVMLNAKSN